MDAKPDLSCDNSDLCIPAIHPNHLLATLLLLMSIKCVLKLETDYMWSL